VERVERCRRVRGEELIFYFLRLEDGLDIFDEMFRGVVVVHGGGKDGIEHAPLRLAYLPLSDVINLHDA
jgi:hypothetical protein